MADTELEVKPTESVGGATSPQPQKKSPEWLAKIGNVKVPEKYVRDKPEDTLAELVKAHGELEHKLSERPKPEAPRPGEGKPDVTDSLAIKPNAEDEDLDAKVTKAGLKIDDLRAKWLAKGDLDDGDYAALGKQGLGRKMVRVIAEGLAAKESVAVQLVSAVATSVENMVGGKQQHDTLREWAGTNIPESELAEHNSRIKADPRYYRTFMEIVQARYAAKNGTLGSRPMVTGTAGSATGGGNITNLNELKGTWEKARRGDAESQAKITALSAAEREALKRMM